MRVLWISNITFPEAIILIKGSGEIKGSGGWLIGLADALTINEGIDLHIASISDLVHDLTTISGRSITYHIIPHGKGDKKYNTEYEKYYLRILDVVEPDIVHIHGTEYPHSLAALKACGREKTVVSIQGMVSVIARYNLAGISKWEAVKNLTIHDLIRGGIIRQQKRMFHNAFYEEELLHEAKYVIGRTSFDRRHTWAINPDIHYYHCDEILRKEFYESDSWNYNKCIPHSIFLSQSSTPIKGLHKVIEALRLVIKQYPDIQLRVAGQDILHSDEGWKACFRMTGYGKIIKKLISKYNLQSHITFLGRQNAVDMVKEYHRANIFLCPSIIENSPNSLGEAQLLGVPCIGAYVGGVPDMMLGDESHLYRYDDVEMLAYKICDIFDKNNSFSTESMQRSAQTRHNPERCIDCVSKVYNIILNKE